VTTIPDETDTTRKRAGFVKVIRTEWPWHLRPETRCLLLDLCVFASAKDNGLIARPLRQLRDDLGWTERQWRSALSALREAGEVELVHEARNQHDTTVLRIVRFEELTAYPFNPRSRLFGDVARRSCW
jgi:hypothetical protein